MGMKKTTLALLAASAIVPVTASAPAAHAETTTKPTCVGVTTQGNSATLAPKVTLVPGDTGSSTLTVTNNGFSDAEVTASLTNVTDPGDQAFADEISLSLGGTSKKVSELIGAESTPMVKATIPAGASVQLPAAYSYDVGSTHVPKAGTQFSYGVLLTLAGDQSNPIDVGCSTAPVIETNPMTIASLPKIGDANGNGKTDAGDTVSYTLDIDNTASTDIQDLVVQSWVVPGIRSTPSEITPSTSSSPTSSPSSVAAASTRRVSAKSITPQEGTELGVVCQATKIPAKGETTCTTTPYTITPADVAAGGITNISKASARNVAGTAVEAPETTAETEALTPPPPPPPSPTPAPTVTITPSPSPTVTVTQTPSPAPTVTVTQTPSPAPTVTQTRAPAPVAVVWTDATQDNPGKGLPIQSSRQIIDAGQAAIAKIGWPSLIGGALLLGSGIASAIWLARRRK